MLFYPYLVKEWLDELVIVKIDEAGNPSWFFIEPICIDYLSNIGVAATSSVISQGK